MRGSHQSNIHVRPVGLCVFVCGPECWGGGILCALWVGLTKLTDPGLAPGRDPLDIDCGSSQTGFLVLHAQHIVGTESLHAK